MANVKFPGIDEDLTAPGTPWIYYGVCYYPFLGAKLRSTDKELRDRMQEPGRPT